MIVELGTGDDKREQLKRNRIREFVKEKPLIVASIHLQAVVDAWPGRKRGR